MNYFKHIILSISFLATLVSCKNASKNTALPDAPAGMVWVPAKTFTQGAKDDDRLAMPGEKPAHQVQVDGFFIDITEVTNQQFKAFVDATQYITVAERAIDWEEVKKELPANTPKPHDSVLQPGSLVFNKKVVAVNDLQNYGQWWEWKIGANWKQPEGPGSSIDDKMNYPVVHVVYEDAMAYCKWANRRLPTEAEWEAAAQGTATAAIFTWGNDGAQLNQKANTWQGVFPTVNKAVDGFAYIAPIKSYEPNSLGIYDLSGNVWEITNDFLNVDYYNSLDTKNVVVNPQGAVTSYNPANPYAIERIIKGGSFLCNASYCASYRISARMGMTADSSADHIGFRTVATPAMVATKK